MISIFHHGVQRWRYEPFPLSHQPDKSTNFIIKTQNYRKAKAEMVYTACYR